MMMLYGHLAKGVVHPSVGCGPPCVQPNLNPFGWLVKGLGNPGKPTSTNRFKRYKLERTRVSLW